LKILGIETSSPIFSLCLNDDDLVLLEFSRQREFDGHKDAMIFNQARGLIDRIGGENIDAIAISIGPGMFTSLRVGLSLAKGISIVYGTPVVAINTLDAIGMMASYQRSPVLVVINAYRGEIYAAFYDTGERTSDHLLTTPAALVETVMNPTLVIGPGTDLLMDRGLDQTNLDISRDEQYLPHASKVVNNALKRIKNNDFDDIEFLEPCYIKMTDAERNHDKRNAI
jgi:tRNA threonylcarbamoyladenosine biosynthesis protein TsaB